MIYIIITIIIEIIGYYSLYFSADKKINALLYNLGLPLGYSLLSIFLSLIINDKRISRLILILIPIILMIIIFNSSSIMKMNFQLFLIFKAFLIIYSIIYLKETLNYEISIYTNPYFWCVTGILFFYTCSFFLSGLINFISSKNLDLAKKLYTITPLLGIIYYSLVTYGFICQRRLARSSS